MIYCNTKSTNKQQQQQQQQQQQKQSKNSFVRLHQINAMLNTIKNHKKATNMKEKVFCDVSAGQRSTGRLLATMPPPMVGLDTIQLILNHGRRQNTKTTEKREIQMIC